MKLTIHTFLTLDGVMQAPGGADEDTSGDFPHGGWLMPLADQDMGGIVGSWFERAEAVLVGRATYEKMYAHWSQVTDPDNIVSEKLNNGLKFVVSSTLRRPPWQNTTVLSGDVIDQVRELKTTPGGELQIHGSASLAQSLHKAGMIDEYRLLVFPVTVGRGKRLFTDDAPANGFKLIESSTTGTGAVYSVLTPATFATGVVTVVDGNEVVIRK
jgi:dihydrofolate reductase